MIRLIDVSSCQGSIDWKRVADTGIRGAIVKVTEGPWTDARARVNLDGAEHEGLVTGVYAFARMSLGEPEPQVEALWKASGRTMPDLPPVLDLESAPDGWGSARIVSWAERWATAARGMFGCWPIAYSYPFFLQRLAPDLAGASVLARCPLWIAHYLWTKSDTPSSELRPFVCKPWTRWTLWQHSGNVGSPVPGIVGPVDHSIFNGDDAAFSALRGLPDDVPTSPDPIIHPSLDFDPPSSR